MKPGAFKRPFILGLGAALFCCVLVFALVEIWPSAGAQAANRLRDLFGPGVVAQIEELVFQAQDGFRKWQYQTGIEQAEAPWALIPTPTASAARTPTRVTQVTPTTAHASPTPTPSATPTRQGTRLPPPASATRTVPPSPTPTPTPTTYAWQPADLRPFGLLEGEGTWQAYLYDQAGRVVAMRTFLQPDPERPYAIVAVVAFDLTRLRLHFVLGFNDPASAEGQKSDGKIPEAHRQAGVLLAAFNGGFRAANGGYGAMADGILSLPPLEAMATVGIYRSGAVRIGSWGETIVATPELEAWRQNCRLVVQDGAISDRVYNDSIVDWGGSISNQIVTRRSGMGLDPTAQTLFYFAGPSLSMPALADAMLASGVYNGMLLDINHFWVHFTAFQPDQNGVLTAEPLLPNDMIDQVDRYLGPSPVDFFYITLLEDSE